MLSGKRWQSDQVVMLGMLIFMCIFGSIIAVRIAQVLLRPYLAPSYDGIIALVVTMIGFQGLALFWVHLFLRKHETSWSEGFGFGRQNHSTCVGLALATLPFVLIAVGVLNAGTGWLMTRAHEIWGWPWLKPQMQSAVELIQKGWPVPVLVLQGFVAIVLAPIAEEVLFRGILYTWIKQRGRPKLALWVSAGLFALIHFHPVGFFSLMLLAVLLVVLYERTQNLLAPILLHALFNGVMFALIVTQPQWAENLQRV